MHPLLFFFNAGFQAPASSPTERVLRIDADDRVLWIERTED